MKKRRSAYARSGVDIVKADHLVGIISRLVQPTLNSAVRKSIGGYASLYRIGGGQYIAATTDGVGTKLKVAFELKKHDTVGIDLVAMSANDLICTGATPLFFLDYFATGKLDLKSGKAVLEGIVEGCRQARLALVGGETAEMPGMYSAGEYDLAGFAVGLVHEKDLIDGSTVRPGDVLIGLESSGPHSNGFSLIRRLLKGDRQWLRKALVPTRIYVPEVQLLSRALGKDLKGLAHITGSGFLNVPRINEKFSYEIILPPSFTTPALFDELRRRGGLTPEELYTTFNMGIGLIAVVPEKAVDRTLKILAGAAGPGRVRAHRLGRVVRKTTTTPIVSIQSNGFRFELRY